MLKCHYTVKKIMEFLEFFLPNLSDSGKNLCWQGIFCAILINYTLSLEEGKVFLHCRGNFFLAGLCYISLKVLSRKITGWFLSGHRGTCQCDHKNWAAEKIIRPLLCVYNLIQMRQHWKTISVSNQLRLCKAAYFFTQLFLSYAVDFWSVDMAVFSL